MSHALFTSEMAVSWRRSAPVHERPLDELLLEENVALVLRYPRLTSDQQLEIMNYALQKTGARFSDVPSVKVHKQLRYVGYLRYEPVTLAAPGE